MSHVCKHLKSLIVASSAYIHTPQLTMGKFDAIILIDDKRSRSLAVQIASKSIIIIVALLACLFAFN